MRVKKCDTCDTAIPEAFFGVLPPFIRYRKSIALFQITIPTAIPFRRLARSEKQRMASCRHLFQYRVRKKYDTSSEALSKNAIPAFEQKMRYRAILRYQIQKLGKKKCDTTSRLFHRSWKKRANCGSNDQRDKEICFLLKEAPPNVTILLKR